MLQATWAAVFRASAAGVEARCINVELLIIISCVRRVLERRWKSARKDSVCSLVKLKRFAASYSDFLFHFFPTLSGFAAKIQVGASIEAVRMGDFPLSRKFLLLTIRPISLSRWRYWLRRGALRAAWLR